MPAYEVLDNSRGGPTDGSKSRRTRKFFVPAPPDTALLDPLVPQRGSVYPGALPNQPFPLILDSYNVDPIGDADNQTFVTCIYTNDRSGRLNPAPDTTHPNFASDSINFQDTVAELPTIYRYRLKIPGAAQFEVDTPTAEEKGYKVEEVLTVRQYRVSLNPFNYKTISVLRAASGKLHMASDGSWWRFKVGRCQQTEKSAWETEYTWTNDSGTPAIMGINTTSDPTEPGSPPYRPVGDPGDGVRWYFPPYGPNLMNGFGGNTADPKLYTRSPWHILTYVLTKNMVPQWSQFCPYDASQPNGWKTLPGGIVL